MSRTPKATEATVMCEPNPAVSLITIKHVEGGTFVSIFESENGTRTYHVLDVTRNDGKSVHAAEVARALRDDHQVTVRWWLGNHCSPKAIEFTCES